MAEITEKELRDLEQECVKLLAFAAFSGTDDESKVKSMTWKNDSIPTFTLGWSDGKAIRITVRAEVVEEDASNGD